MSTTGIAPPTLLLVDDDDTFRQILAHALGKRGYQVVTAHSVEDAIPLATQDPPEYAVLDLKMQGASGLVLVKYLHQLNAQTRIIVLTGYASVSTAVEAIKLGATHYLAKPVNADEIVAAFYHQADPHQGAAPEPPSVERMEWEHIQRVLYEHQGNISATARALKMHRRTLQRKLSKIPVKS